MLMACTRGVGIKVQKVNTLITHSQGKNKKADVVLTKKVALTGKPSKAFIFTACFIFATTSTSRSD